MMNGQAEGKPKISLDELKLVYSKYFDYGDFARFELVFAAYLTACLDGNTPIWLIIVAPSGDGKTEQLRALTNERDTRVVHHFTSKTLVSGKKNERDLAPELNRKIVIIYDFAELLNVHPNEKVQIWSQLRNLYDGFAGMDSGGGARKQYSNLFVTMISASTPAIDEQILIQNQLGTRELILRCSIPTTRKKMESVWLNNNVEDEMRAELNEKTVGFLHDRWAAGKLDDVAIPDKVKNEIFRMAEYLRVMRATAAFDSYSGELRSYCYPEEPTRVLKQLKRLYYGLKSLDDTYSDDMALDRLWLVVNGSIDPIRNDLLKRIVHYPDGVTSYQLAKDIKVGNKTVHSQLFLLWSLDLIKCDVEEIINYGRTTEKRRWSPNFKNKITESIGLVEGILEKKLHGVVSTK